MITGDITIYHAIVALILGLVVGAVAALVVRKRRSEPRRSARRILFPFTGHAISRRALDSAFRLARAEDAVLVPVYLATVPLRLALEAPVPLQCETALPLLDAIEANGARYGVEVEARIEKGRSPRSALQALVEQETFDRVVLPASSRAQAGFSGEDVAWILEHVDAEVVVFRAASRDEKVLAGVA
jgi:nucleotide-binding universal stress UspA family protein